MTARWLTDNPHSTEGFLPEGVTWKPLEASACGDDVGTVLKAFQPGSELWGAESREPDGGFPGRIHLLVDTSGQSQFDQALACLKSKELPDGLICVALTGSGFRGQRKRPWQAIRGNLHLTAHYDLGVPVREAQACLTMLPAVASAEAIDEQTPPHVRPEIKWVNDVLIGGSKVSGVLTASQLSGGQFDRAVFGIGVNVAHAPEIEPTPFVPRAGCLYDGMDAEGRRLPALYHTLVKKLDELVNTIKAGDCETIFARYAGRAGFVGRRVCIWPEGTEDWQNTACGASGVVTELLPDMSLRIEGYEQPVRSGRMAFAENC